MKHPWSLRTRLVFWLIVPVAGLMTLDTIGLYHRGLVALNSAYDRSLLGSARMIGDLLEIRQNRLVSIVPYTVIEFYEADNRSRLLYRIKGFHGEHVAGYEDFPDDPQGIPAKATYPITVSFFDADYHGEALRVASLYQAVASSDDRGLALVQVAEPLSLRQSKARRLLGETIAWQLVYLAATIILTWLVVTAFLSPLRRLEHKLLHRSPGDLSPLTPLPAVRELDSLVRALNEVMGRLHDLLDHQRRFIRDASHQLKTPLAVMKIQLQLAQRGDASDPQFLADITQTTERAVNVTNQLLALAKIEQIRGLALSAPVDLAAAARSAVVGLSSLISDKALHFELTGAEPTILAHGWMIEQLMTNLLSNAVRHTPQGAMLGLDIAATPQEVVIRVWNAGPAIAPEIADRLFEPFSTTDPLHGTGLGLAICYEIVRWLGGTVVLRNCTLPDQGTGVEAVVRLARGLNPA
ncbi:sensor histidine kinase [Variovorax terrae]|uniref:histidine kinase n=1 Tax=Variovorax terrae TaxID=2923278 RepID=A0A9X1VU62_9BURK|nr:sensor histidine kinase [Variovorax terrae]MCJ0761912.1 sensor histidine kinase [Variovorax terrae]